MNKFKKPAVALLFGGRGYEREVSVRGASNLFSLIPSEKYRKIPIFIDPDGRFLLPDVILTSEAESGKLSESSPAEATPQEMAVGNIEMREVHPAYIDGHGGFIYGGEFLPIDAAFPLLHGDYGEDGILQGALECAKIAYIGCDVIGSAAARDKILLKAIASSLDIPVARGILCLPGEVSSVVRESERLFGYPVFVKPTRLGSSIGAGVAGNRRELYSALIKALSLGSRAVVEEYIDIEKELECAYFAVSGKELFTNPGEICGYGFYDYEKKYALTQAEPKAQGEARTEPEVSDCAELDKETRGRVLEYARRLVRELSLRDLARIDFFLDKNGRLYFNEINTMPGFTETSLYMRLVARYGIPPVALICSLIDSAIMRGA